LLRIKPQVAFLSYPHQSTLATIQFGSPSGFLLGGTSVTDGLAVGDLDGDALPEIVVSEFLSPTEDFYSKEFEVHQGH